MPTATFQCNNITALRRNAKKIKLQYLSKVQMKNSEEKISSLLTAPYEHAKLRINVENITPIPYVKYEHAKLLKYGEISRR